jgi:N utilization substance protein B
LTSPRSPNAVLAARRAAARLAAVQALYQMEMTGANAEQALKDAIERAPQAPAGMADPDQQLLADIIRGVNLDPAALDGFVGQALTNEWTVDRLEAVLRAILRAGAWEIRQRPKTPARVAISEYVDIAHAFYAGPEPGLVNAVLDRIARAARPDEFGRA